MPSKGLFHSPSQYSPSKGVGTEHCGAWLTEGMTETLQDKAARAGWALLQDPDTAGPIQILIPDLQTDSLACCQDHSNWPVQADNCSSSTYVAWRGPGHLERKQASFLMAQPQIPPITGKWFYWSFLIMKVMPDHHL